jgi:hypothetical protein
MENSPVGAGLPGRGKVRRLSSALLDLAAPDRLRAPGGRGVSRPDGGGLRQDMQRARLGLIAWINGESEATIVTDMARIASSCSCRRCRRWEIAAHRRTSLMRSGCDR